MKRLNNFFLAQNIKYHILIIIGFALFSLLFYYPVLSGKKILQSDSVQYAGMSRQLKDYKEKNNEETYWIDNAFGGMPTYQLGAKFPFDVLTPIHKIFHLFPHPVYLLFLYLFSFYILLLILSVPIELSALGALAYGLSTYLLIIIQVGHNTKAQALGYLPLVISGILLIFKERYKLGFIITVIAIALNIRANHYQITYYIILFLIPFFIIQFNHYYKKKRLRVYLKNNLLIVCAGIISLGLNASSILSTSEYSKFSTRGKSEISLSSNGNFIEPSSGLEYDYITQFSYGIYETFNIIIPRIQGGGSTEDLGKDSELYKHLIVNGIGKNQADDFIENVPTYWGNQPILEAPAYIGVSVVFFAILSILLSLSSIKIWLLIGSFFSIALSWGKNFSLMTSFFIENIPLYNKFRSVSSIQVILEFCIPVLAILGLKEYFYSENKNKKKKLLQAFGIMMFLFIVLFLTKSFNSFIGPYDSYYSNMFGSEIMEKIRHSRKYIFNQDIFRAVLITIVSFIVLLFYLKNKNQYKKIIIVVFLIIIYDLLSISNRYIDRDLFVSKSKSQNHFSMTLADKSIIKDTTRYRVYEPSLGLSNARTSYFHNSIGGYHGAKPRRFEELYNLFIDKEIGGIIDMLNVKYLLYRNKENKFKVMKNSKALGNAWFVENLIKIKSIDSVYKRMASTDFSNTAITSSHKAKLLRDTYNIDSNSKIKLVENKPNYLKYKFSSLNDSFIVFSEIYYPNGWKVKIDNELSDHFDVNYILRGLFVKKGDHIIEFEFDPEIVKIGSIFQISSLSIFIILILSFSFFSKKI